jgi:hypothetical protein
MYVELEDSMKPTEQTRKHVISTYVQPARQRGAKTVQIRVGNVQKELGWTNRTPSVFSTLSSKEFQNEAGIELIQKVGGPPSGGPSTTVQFVYQVLDRTGNTTPAAKVLPQRDGLRELYGLCAGTFKALGGGEEFLRREREWEPDAWERYQAEELKRQNEKAAK